MQVTQVMFFGSRDTHGDPDSYGFPVPDVEASPDSLGDTSS